MTCLILLWFIKMIFIVVGNKSFISGVWKILQKFRSNISFWHFLQINYSFIHKISLFYFKQKWNNVKLDFLFLKLNRSTWACGRECHLPPPLHWTKLSTKKIHIPPPCARHCTQFKLITYCSNVRCVLKYIIQNEEKSKILKS